LVVLEIILSHEYCDVDPINRLDKATPLHLAVATEDPEDRRTLVESLLDAGADFTFVRFILRSPTVTVVYILWFGYRIRNKYGQTAQELVKSDDPITLELFTKAQAEASIARDDIACTS
jgi:hypothetical protein